MKRIKAYTENPEFQPEKIKTVSSAAYGLCCWVRAMEAYDRVAKVRGWVGRRGQARGLGEGVVWSFTLRRKRGGESGGTLSQTIRCVPLVSPSAYPQVVEPKKKKLGEAEAELEVVMTALRGKQAELKEVMDKLASLDADLRVSLGWRVGWGGPGEGEERRGLCMSWLEGRQPFRLLPHAHPHPHPHPLLLCTPGQEGAQGQAGARRAHVQRQAGPRGEAHRGARGREDALDCCGHDPWRGVREADGGCAAGGGADRVPGALHGGVQVRGEGGWRAEGELWRYGGCEEVRHGSPVQHSL